MSFKLSLFPECWPEWNNDHIQCVICDRHCSEICHIDTSLPKQAQTFSSEISVRGEQGAGETRDLALALLCPACAITPGAQWAEN